MSGSTSTATTTRWWRARLTAPVWWFPRTAARRAIERCYGVPYLSELNRREHRGMKLLEQEGEVIQDIALTGSGIYHWHRAP